MIGRVLGLLAVAAAAAGGVLLAERILARRSADGVLDVPLLSHVTIAAPIEHVWTVLADVPGQPRWMHDMKAVRVLSPGPLGVGTIAEADVRILGVGVLDPVMITEFRPPDRFAVRHDGLFTGSGEIALRPGDEPGTTDVDWVERLVPPVLPNLGQLLGAPILGRVFQADLDRFKALVETGRPDRR